MGGAQHWYVPSNYLSSNTDVLNQKKFANIWILHWNHVLSKCFVSITNVSKIIKVKPLTRFELATPALREQCSNHWATVALDRTKRCVLFFRSAVFVILSHISDVILATQAKCSHAFCFSYLSQCRLFSVSMENFVKFIKHTISKVSPEISLDKAREELLSECDRYFEEVR